MFDLQRTLQLIKGALFDPESTWRSYLPEAGNWQRTAVLITVPLVVTALFIAYLLGLLTGSNSMFGMRMTFSALLLGIANGLIGLALVSFIYSFMAGLVGGKRDFALGLAAISLVVVPAYVGQALSTLPLVGWIASLATAIYTLVLLWQIIPLYLAVPENKRILHYVASFIVTFVASTLLALVLGVGRS